MSRLRLLWPSRLTGKFQPVADYTMAYHMNHVHLCWIYACIQYCLQQAKKVTNANKSYLDHVWYPIIDVLHQCLAQAGSAGPEHKHGDPLTPYVCVDYDSVNRLLLQNHARVKLFHSVGLAGLPAMLAQSAWCMEHKCNQVRSFVPKQCSYMVDTYERIRDSFLLLVGCGHVAQVQKDCDQMQSVFQMAVLYNTTIAFEY